VPTCQNGRSPLVGHRLSEKHMFVERMRVFGVLQGVTL
jgi:hypothetical protein